MSHWKELEDPRLSAMFDVLKNGQSSSVAMLQAADTIPTQPEGSSSSLKELFNTKYQSHLKWIVYFAREINEEGGEPEDSDFSLSFIKHDKFKWLEGMEIDLKLVRSKKGESAFRKSHTYQNVNGAIIVMRIGDNPSQNEFVHRFKGELVRIGNIYRQFDKS